ncbi:hypothetical protein PF005_g24124 [Phytophthora fragariae]|uniref:Uncharacterized protein n=1 Tax=Phytophthora fragariae TaxID=53985 RepID=A0A6A3W371_9STRA|nr:hypothetical protein PF005_g24124 [Phytophthora fragariae]KAE9189368.1 hypothetical protein PF002_g25065 [Phytophthora fragariae]
MLVMLKNSGAWEMLSNIFYVKTATFIKTITNFVPVVAPQLYVDWVKEKVQEESMRMLVTSDPTAQHKLYGYKVEANEALHHATRSKTDKDRMLLDTGLLSAEYPDEWAVFAGKGYQGAKQHVCCINPTKDTNLSAAVAQQNADISSDRIIVENWFGKFVGYGVFAPTSTAGRRTSTMTSSRPVQR